MGLDTITEFDSITDAKSYFNKGNIHYEKGEYKKAIEQYTKAIVLNRLYSEAYFNRALCYYNLKDYDSAIEDYTKALELDPNNPILYNNRGDAFYLKEDYKKAIEDYSKALTLNNKYMKAYYNRGLAHACIEEYEKAIEDFSNAIDLAPSFAQSYHLRGMCYEYLKQYEKAKEDFTKALELNPDFEEAKERLQTVENALQNPDALTSSGGTEGQNQGINAIKFLKKPNMTFNDVAGMDKLKEEIREAIVYPLLKPDLARAYGKKAGGGILLYGPPGCGKTFIVKGAAGECNANFINAKISDLLDMYVGNTEKNIHNLFDTARKNAPCIVFIDEIEGIGGRREELGGQQQYLKMAINQLLYEMDGLEANNENVLTIAATNAPWDVDPALRRSGRFSKLIYVPEPDFKSRIQILQMHCKGRPIETKNPLTRVDFNRLAICTLGYSSSDLKTIVEDAASIPWKEAFKTGRMRTIQMKDFIQAIKKRKSSLPPWYQQAKKQIGKQEEISYIDGKEHKTVKESKMGPAEREVFQDLIKVIERNNKWYYKWAKEGFRQFFLYFPIAPPWCPW
ncbi:MAG: tetratricopeptide repeat protein [Candidatus Micrarchaeota archaeon]|nr:tetratricopeptide repeat protein [Candidatus Micrarchaeota archaeon]